MCVYSSTARAPQQVIHILNFGLLRLELWAHAGLMNQKKSVETVLTLLGKTAPRKALLDRGVTAWALQQAVASGSVSRSGRGVYSLPGADAFDMHLAQSLATLDCLSRAERMKLWVLHSPSQPHVATSHGRAVAGCVVHRVRGRATFWDCLRHCLQCSSDMEALCILESAVVLKKCTMAQYRRVFTKRKDARARRIVDMIDMQSMSIAETCGRYQLRNAGYTVQVQAYVKNAGHLDLLVDGVLGIEVDGQKYHNTPEGWVEDLRRDTMYVLNGVWRLRIPAAIVLYRPEIMLQWVEQALATIASARR